MQQGKFSAAEVWDGGLINVTYERGSNKDA